MHYIYDIYVIYLLHPKNPFRSWRLYFEKLFLLKHTNFRCEKTKLNEPDRVVYFKNTLHFKMTNRQHQTSLGYSTASVDAV